MLKHSSTAAANQAAPDRDVLAALQSGQRRHDERCHTDILVLPVQRRLTHFVLHLAKYGGSLIGKGLEEASYRRIVVDTTIIGLAAANCLAIDLPKAPFQHEATRQKDFLTTLLVATGYMAKACEALDHVEKFDSRGHLERGVLEILQACFWTAQDQGFDLARLIEKRWMEVEERCGFFARG